MPGRNLNTFPRQVRGSDGSLRPAPQSDTEWPESVSSGGLGPRGPVSAPPRGADEGRRRSQATHEPHDCYPPAAPARPPDGRSIAEAAIGYSDRGPDAARRQIHPFLAQPERTNPACMKAGPATGSPSGSPVRQAPAGCPPADARPTGSTTLRWKQGRAPGRPGPPAQGGLRPRARAGKVPADRAAAR